MKNLKQIYAEKESFTKLEKDLEFFDNILYCKELMRSHLFLRITIDEDCDARILCLYDQYSFEDSGEYWCKGLVPYEGIPYLLGKKPLPVGLACSTQISLAKKLVKRYKEIMANPMS